MPRRPRERTRLDLDARRAQLVDLGLELFRQHGYEALSIDEIARRAGVSKGLLYHYFPSKRDYYLATVRTGAERLVAATLARAAATDPERRLREALGAYLDVVTENREAYLSLMRSALGADREVLDVIESVRRRLADRLLEGLQADDEDLLRIGVRGLVGCVEAAVMEWLERPGASREAVVELLVAQATAVVAAAGGRLRAP